MATDRNKRDNEQREESSYRNLVSQALGMGFSVVIFVVLGVFLDSSFHTTPLFILLGVFFSLASVAYLMYKLVKSPK